MNLGCEEIEAFLSAAKKMAGAGNACEAERAFKQILTYAESAAGEASALSGLVLLDFADFLEKQGRAQEADQLYVEIGRILRGYSDRVRRQIT